MRRTTRAVRSEYLAGRVAVVSRSCRTPVTSRRTARVSALQHRSSREARLFQSPRSWSVGAREWSGGDVGVLEVFAPSTAAVSSYTTGDRVHAGTARVGLHSTPRRSRFIARVHGRYRHVAVFSRHVLLALMWRAAARAPRYNHLTACARLPPPMRRCSLIVRSRYLTDSSLYSWCGFAAI